MSMPAQRMLSEWELLHTDDGRAWLREWCSRTRLTGAAVKWLQRLEQTEERANAMAGTDHLEDMPFHKWLYSDDGPLVESPEVARWREETRETERANAMSGTGYGKPPRKPKGGKGK